MPDAFIKSTFNHHYHHQHFLLMFKIPFLSQLTFDIYKQNTITYYYNTNIAHIALDPQSTIHRTGEFKCRRSEKKRMKKKRIFKKWKECERVDFHCIYLNNHFHVRKNHQCVVQNDSHPQFTYTYTHNTEMSKVNDLLKQNSTHLNENCRLKF